MYVCTCTYESQNKSVFSWFIPMTMINEMKFYTKFKKRQKSRQFWPTISFFSSLKYLGTTFHGQP